jgi:hypothetical protein
LSSPDSKRLVRVTAVFSKCEDEESGLFATDSLKRLEKDSILSKSPLKKPGFGAASRDRRLKCGN